MRQLTVYALLTFIVFTGSCTKDKGGINRGDYPVEIGKLITTNCAISGCHNAASNKAAASLNLSTWKDLFSGSVNGSPVIPYSSRFSSLCYFINTYPEEGTQNLPTMPINSKPLSLEAVKKIKSWIDDGAKDINGNLNKVGDPNRKKLYVVNQGCDVVTVIDSDTQLPIRYIDVGNKASADVPHQVRVSPDGKFWYVIFIENNVMQKFRCSDDSYVGQIPLTPFAAGWSANPLSDANNWNTFVISSNSKYAYCVSWSANGKVAALDLENMKLLHYLPGLNNPHGIALNKTENKLYVAAQYGNYITVLDTNLNSSGIDFSIQNGVPPNPARSIDPHDLILSKDGANLLITCQGSNEVRVFNISSNSVTAVIPTGTFPQEIVYSNALNQYFVSCTDDKENGANGSVSKIDGSTFAHIKKPCGYQPHGLAVDETKNLLYVLSRNTASSGPPAHHTSQCAGKNGFVNFIDLNNFSLLAKKYELSVDPYFIFARP